MFNKLFSPCGSRPVCCGVPVREIKTQKKLIPEFKVTKTSIFISFVRSFVFTFQDHSSVLSVKKHLNEKNN